VTETYQTALSAFSFRAAPNGYTHTNIGNTYFCFSKSQSRRKLGEGAPYASASLTT
jgi:hypothetical protein